MASILVWLILLIAFIIVVSLLFKLLKALAKAVAYSVILFALVGIILLFFVHASFSVFVSDLDKTNLYVYQENDQILFGYQDNPYEALNSVDIAKLNINKDKFKRIKYEKDTFDNAVNLFVYNKQALLDKPTKSIVFNENTYSPNDAKNILISGQMSVLEKGRMFALLTQEWNSTFLFPEHRLKNIIVYPKRFMFSFVDNAPKFLVTLFGFERKFRGGENGQPI